MFRTSVVLPPVICERVSVRTGDLGLPRSETSLNCLHAAIDGLQDILCRHRMRR